MLTCFLEFNRRVARCSRHQFKAELILNRGIHSKRE